MINGSTSVSSGGSTSAAKTFGTEATAANMASADLAWQRNQQAIAQQQAYNAQQAQLNREWQEKMANTAYQRAVADMKAAKINPILAYAQGGAATPGGATASSSALGASMGTAVADQISTGSSWNSAESYSNIGEQIAGTIAAIAEIFKGLKDDDKSSATKEFVEDVEKGTKGLIWKMNQNVAEQKQIQKDLWDHRKEVLAQRKANRKPASETVKGR